MLCIDWQAYHKFVNTTPKPSATKNNNGEFVGLDPWSPWSLCVGVAVGEEVVEVEAVAMIAVLQLKVCGINAGVTISKESELSVKRFAKSKVAVNGWI